MLHLLHLSQDGPHLALSRHRLRAPPSFLSFLVLAFACSSFLGPLTQLPCRALADRRRRRGCRARRAHCATALDTYCRLRAHHVTRDKGKSRSRREAGDLCASQLRERIAMMQHALVAHHLNSISSLLRRHFAEALDVGIGILKVAKLPSISCMLAAYCMRRSVKS